MVPHGASKALTMGRSGTYVMRSAHGAPDCVSKSSSCYGMRFNVDGKYRIFKPLSKVLPSRLQDRQENNAQ